MSSSGWTPLGLEGLGRAWLGFSPCGIALQKTSLGLVTWWRSIPTCRGVKLKEQAFIEIFVVDSFTMVPLAQTNHVAGPGVVGGDYSRRQRNHGTHPTICCNGPGLGGTVISSAPTPLAEWRAMSRPQWRKWEMRAAQEEEEETVLVNTDCLPPSPQVVVLSSSLLPATSLRGYEADSSVLGPLMVLEPHF